MNRSHVARMALITAIGMFSGAAFAQADADRRVQYKAKTEIDFEGLDVAGELVKPAGALLLDRKKASFNPLIRLRTDFNEEMKESVDQIK